MVSGPPESLSRCGIERGRTWLEAETGTMEIRGGDAASVDRLSVLLDTDDELDVLF